MHPTTIIGAVLLCLGVLAAPVGAGDIIQGRITAINAASLDIDGRTYVITDDTSCEDKAGRKVAPSELLTGTPVEAEIADDGKLGVVTVDLLR